jgi:hypothetical protein
MIELSGARCTRRPLQPGDGRSDNAGDDRAAVETGQRAGRQHRGDHAHIPEPEGVSHPLFARVRTLIDKGKTGVKLSGAYQDTKVGPPTYADSTVVAQAYATAAPERCV